jgi:hypothetical protein
MKPQRNNYAIAFMLLIGISGYCQNSGSNDIFINTNNLITIDLISKELVGTYYINNEFVPGKVSNQKAVYLMRYNAFKDIMEMELNNKPYYFPLSTNYSVTFESLNKTYQVLDYKEKEITKKGLFVVVFIGDEISLFIKEKIKFFEEVKAKTGYDKYKPPTLKRVDDEFYIGYKNSSAIALPNKKKDIISLFGSKANAIESYAKENNLGFKNEEDLIKIFRFYSTLK